MDVLSLDRHSEEVEIDVRFSIDVVDILVNGERLRDMWVAAGGTEFHALETVPPLNRADDKPTWVQVLRSWCEFLGCGCGVEGGAAYVTASPDFVTWSVFRDGEKGRISLGPFTFDRSAYEAALG